MALPYVNILIFCISSTVLTPLQPSLFVCPKSNFDTALAVNTRISLSSESQNSRLDREEIQMRTEEPLFCSSKLA